MSADDSGVGADVLGVVSSKGDIVAQGDNGVVMHGGNIELEVANESAIQIEERSPVCMWTSGGGSVRAKGGKAVGGKVHIRTVST